MILPNQSEDVVVVSDSVAKAATINGARLAKLQYLLSQGLYKDGIGSTITELTNNAIDSIAQSGKDLFLNPARVYIEKDSNNDGHQLRVVDNGTGLNEQEFGEILMDYLNSTKEEDSDSLGCWGLGAKSWTSVSNSATFICVKDGMKYTMLAYKGGNFVEYDKLDEEETEEENGVAVIVPIKNGDYFQFAQKARQKLCYYDHVLLYQDGKLVENKIYRSQDFQWSTLNTYNEIHFSLKDVVYKIDWSALDVDKIPLPICLRFGLKDGIIPTPSREDIIYNEDIKKLFRQKIEKVAHWFLSKYNETVTQYPSLAQAYHSIGQNTYFVNVEGRNFQINSLLDEFDLVPEEATVQGIVLRPPKFYKERSYYGYLYYGYKTIGQITSNRSWTSKHLERDIDKHMFRNKYRVILLSKIPVGYVRSYLTEKYYKTDLFVVKSDEEFVLGLHNTKNRYAGTYYSLLNLSEVPKEEWRAHIQEFQAVQKSVTDLFVDERYLENSSEYQTWLSNKKFQQKIYRPFSNKISKVIEKKEGEVIIGYARESEVYVGIPVFEKASYPIKDLEKNGYLTVYFSESEKEEAKMIGTPALRTGWLDIDEDGNKKKGWLRTAIIGVKEQAKIKNLHNFKTLKEFYMSRPFSRLATCLLIEQYIKLIPKNQELIYEAFPKYLELKSKVLNYQNRFKGTSYSTEMDRDIMKVAEEKDLWDMTIYPEFLEFKKIIETFGFLSVFKDTDNWRTTDEEKKIMKNLIYSTLIVQKKMNNLSIADMELVPKESIRLVTNPGYAYYQPQLDLSGFIIGHDETHIASFEVWEKRENLIKAYPNCNPIGYRQGFIENPVYVDLPGDDDDEEDEDEDLEEEIIEEIEEELA